MFCCVTADKARALLCVAHAKFRIQQYGFVNPCFCDQLFVLCSAAISPWFVNGL